MELSKELLQKQIEILLHAIENGKIDNRKYYPTLYLDDLINMAENSEESGYNVERMVAASAIKYPDLHNLIRNLVQQITIFNLKAWDNYDDFWLLHANDMDYAGAAYAKELAIANQNDIQTYIDFYLTNDVNHEVYQGKDIEAILEKWGVSEITYPLIVARWFEPGQHGDEQLEEYFDSMIEKFTDSSQCDLFIKACANWFLNRIQKDSHEIDFDDKEMLNRLFSSLFDEVENYEDYMADHEDDEDFDEENIYGSVINKFCDYVKEGKLPTYSDLL
ncbi:hypothetical protein M2475_000480 [Breznakia sp. PF5-3]|uniref:hypothetical protein n=1 Tax=unclassified Breznakia TaxID=2623764 RepID=UPI0024073B93|nr:MULTISPECIES: hypothetical protein [unclassified Breznakia]MDF9824130.1 hypothetical protein [Breznakia sp. PM6-1]MDF9834928.1 hypothetical protein [Breznakia sp. PF5-3]MDF9837203.1 hypothetical protein [Breznakia sp. PFB2-8]MDF9859193.1 hypothetical protein [Breznakia sp. PH5-24]